jgi:membrane associated rhomboid family serine protease
LPAWIILGIWLFIQLLSVASASSLAQGGVAFMAHLGGFFAGAVLYRFFKKGNSEPPRSPWQSISMD